MGSRQLRDRSSRRLGRRSRRGRGPTPGRNTRSGSGRIETDYGTAIIAAAEAIAALRGNPGARLPRQLVEWVAAHRAIDAASHVAKALALLDAVLSDASELRELWQENEESYPAWTQGIHDLKRRVNGG